MSVDNRELERRIRKLEGEVSELRRELRGRRSSLLYWEPFPLDSLNVSSLSPSSGIRFIPLLIDKPLDFRHFLTYQIASGPTNQSLRVDLYEGLRKNLRAEQPDTGYCGEVLRRVLSIGAIRSTSSFANRYHALSLPRQIRLSARRSWYIGVVGDITMAAIPDPGAVAGIQSLELNAAQLEEVTLYAPSFSSLFGQDWVTWFALLSDEYARRAAIPSIGVRL